MSELLLPDKLSLDGTYEEIISKLYKVFKSDLVYNRLYFKALPVVFDNRKIDCNYEEGLWHVISRGKEERILDYKRAKRLPWLRPIVENYKQPEILCWYEERMKPRGLEIAHHLWYVKGKYLIVLKEKPGRYYLATAFYIFGYKHESYMKSYQRAKKKGIDY